MSWGAILLTVGAVILIGAVSFFILLRILLNSWPKP